MESLTASIDTGFGQGVSGGAAFQALPAGAVGTIRLFIGRARPNTTQPGSFSVTQACYLTPCLKSILPQALLRLTLRLQTPLPARAAGYAGCWAAWGWCCCWCWLWCSFLTPGCATPSKSRWASKRTGQYSLAIGELHTSLWNRSIRLRHLRLRPAAQVADSLPRLRFDLAQLHVSGVGLWALLRRQVVPIDSVVLDSARLNVLALARRPSPKAQRAAAPAAAAHLDGLQIDYLGLLHAQARYHPATQPRGGFARPTWWPGTCSSAPPGRPIPSAWPTPRPGSWPCAGRGPR